MWGGLLEHKMPLCLRVESCVAQYLIFYPSWPTIFLPCSTAPNVNNHQAEAVYGDKNSMGMVTELVAFTLPLLVVW